MASGKSRNEQQLRRSGIPDIAQFGAFKRDTALRKILCKAAPGGEVELCGAPQLRKISVEPGASREQFEDSILIENVDLIFPDHVVDRRKLTAIAHEQRSEGGDFIFHSKARALGPAERLLPLVFLLPPRLPLCALRLQEAARARRSQSDRRGAENRRAPRRRRLRPARMPRRGRSLLPPCAQLF